MVLLILVVKSNHAEWNRVCKKNKIWRRTCERDSVKSVYKQKKYFPFRSIFLEKELNKCGTLPLFRWNVAFSLFITVRQTTLIFYKCLRFTVYLPAVTSTCIWTAPYSRQKEFMSHFSDAWCVALSPHVRPGQKIFQMVVMLQNRLWHKRKGGRLNRDEATAVDEST